MIVLIWVFWALVSVASIACIWKLGRWISRWWSDVPKAAAYPSRTFRPEAEPDPFPMRPLAKAYPKAPDRPVSRTMKTHKARVAAKTKAKRGKKKP
jgi:hypothetical protein